MVTNIQDFAPYDTIADFHRIAARIELDFDALIYQLIERRDVLCQQDEHIVPTDKAAAVCSHPTPQLLLLSHPLSLLQTQI